MCEWSLLRSLAAEGCTVWSNLVDIFGCESEVKKQLKCVTHVKDLLDPTEQHHRIVVGVASSCYAPSLCCVRL